MNKPKLSLLALALMFSIPLFASPEIVENIKAQNFEVMKATIVENQKAFVDAMDATTPCLEAAVSRADINACRSAERKRITSLEANLKKAKKL